jgi:hypothetical protein
VLSGTSLCDELITRPEESYRLWCVIVCDLETSRMRRPWPAMGRSATKKKSHYIWTIFYTKPCINLQSEWYVQAFTVFTHTASTYRIYHSIKLKEFIISRCLDA